MKKTTKTPAVVREEQWRAKLEVAAYAAWQMENDRYPFPQGVARGRLNEDGSREWNKAELMRLVDRPQSHDYDAVFKDEWFLRALEYQRWRNSDPTFRKRVKNEIGRLTIELAFDRVYEQLKFHPEDITLDQALKVIKTYVDAGVKIKKGEVQDKMDELLGALSNEERKLLMEEQRKHLTDRLQAMDSRNLAIEGMLDGED